MQRLCKTHDITIIDSYIDRAFSATTDRRPAFQKTIKDSAKNMFDVIIVWKLDRFARNRYDSAHYKAQLRKNGVKVISANENISESSEGIILESVLEGMAEYYSADLSEKVIRGLTENAIKCKFNSDPITFGFNFEPASILGTFVFRGFFYARILLFTAVFEPFQQSVAVNGKQSRTDCAAKFRLIGYENLCVQPLLQHFFQKHVFGQMK